MNSKERFDLFLDRIFLIYLKNRLGLIQANTWGSAKSRAHMRTALRQCANTCASESDPPSARAGMPVRRGGLTARGGREEKHNITQVSPEYRSYLSNSCHANQTRETFMKQPFMNRDCMAYKPTDYFYHTAACASCLVN